MTVTTNNSRASTAPVRQDGACTKFIFSGAHVVWGWAWVSEHLERQNVGKAKTVGDRKFHVESKHWRSASLKTFSLTWICELRRFLSISKNSLGKVKWNYLYVSSLCTSENQCFPLVSSVWWTKCWESSESPRVLAFSTIPCTRVWCCFEARQLKIGYIRLQSHCLQIPSPDIILCGWLRSKHQLTNLPWHSSLTLTGFFLFFF